MCRDRRVLRRGQRLPQAARMTGSEVPPRTRMASSLVFRSSALPATQLRRDQSRLRACPDPLPTHYGATLHPTDGGPWRAGGRLVDLLHHSRPGAGQRTPRRAYARFREQFGSTPVMTDACSCSLVLFLDEFDPARPCLLFPASPASGLAIVHPHSLATCGRWLNAPKPNWLTDPGRQTTLGRFASRSRVVGGTLARLRVGQNPLQLLFSLRPQPEPDLELRKLTCGDPR